MLRYNFVPADCFVEWLTNKVLVGCPRTRPSFKSGRAAGRSFIEPLIPWLSNNEFSNAKMTKAFFSSLMSLFSERDKVFPAPAADLPSIWLRDFMAIPSNGRCYQFEPCLDYMAKKEQKRYRKCSQNQAIREIVIATGRGYEEAPLRLDGGNVVMNSRYVIVSEKVFADNSTMFPGEVGHLLAETFDNRTPIFVRTEKEETTGHVTRLLRFLHDDVLLINDLREVDYDLHVHNLDVLADLNCEIVTMPYKPVGTKRYGWYPMAGNYMNFAATENTILISTFGQAEEEEVVEMLQDYDRYHGHASPLSSGCRRLI